MPPGPGLFGAELLAEWERYRGDGQSLQQLANSMGIKKGTLTTRLKTARMVEKIGSAEQKKPEQEGETEQAVPVVVGVTPNSDLIDPDKLWRAAFEAQATAANLINLKRSQLIEIKDARPIGMAFLSDTHFGGAFTDYRLAKEDADIIRSTPGLYCGYYGDGWDNWITEKLQHLERGQAMPFDAEVQLFAAYLGLLKGKLIFAIPGNHELWTQVLSGFDQVRECLRGTQVLYDRYEIVFTLKIGEMDWVVKARHSWRHSSVFNATHGIEVGWERGSDDFDIGIGGHTHIGTLCRPFLKQGRKRYAIVTGTYKVSDPFADKIGFARATGSGCGAMIFYPDGRLFWCEDLRVAADFLGYLRNGR